MKYIYLICYKILPLHSFQMGFVITRCSSIFYCITQLINQIMKFNFVQIKINGSLIKKYSYLLNISNLVTNELTINLSIYITYSANLAQYQHTRIWMGRCRFRVRVITKTFKMVITASCPRLLLMSLSKGNNHKKVHFISYSIDLQTKVV